MSHCVQCLSKATHVVISAPGEVSEEEIFLCTTHANGSDYHTCSCCEMDGGVDTSEGTMETTWEAEKIGSDGCCNWHP